MAPAKLHAYKSDTSTCASSYSCILYTGIERHSTIIYAAMSSSIIYAAMSSSRSSLLVASKVRGFRVCSEIWEPYIREELQCFREEDNDHDPYAVSIIKSVAISLFS